MHTLKWIYTYDLQMNSSYVISFSNELELIYLYTSIAIVSIPLNGFYSTLFIHLDTVKWFQVSQAIHVMNQSLYVMQGIPMAWRCPWCNGYHHRIWTRQQEFKSWTWLIAFHIALIPLGKVWIQIYSLQLWVNSRAD